MRFDRSFEAVWNCGTVLALVALAEIGCFWVLIASQSVVVWNQHLRPRNSVCDGARYEISNITNDKENTKSLEAFKKFTGSSPSTECGSSLVQHAALIHLRTSCDLHLHISRQSPAYHVTELP